MSAGRKEQAAEQAERRKRRRDEEVEREKKKEERREGRKRKEKKEERKDLRRKKEPDFARYRAAEGIMAAMRSQRTWRRTKRARTEDEKQPSGERHEDDVRRRADDAGRE